MSYKSDFEQGTYITSLAANRLGAKHCAEDPVKTTAVGAQIQSNTARPVELTLVKNTSGSALLPYEIVKFEAGYRGLHVDGYAGSADDPVAGVVDPLLPAAGVPDDGYFYIVTYGPCKIRAQADTSAITTGSRISSDTAGRFKEAADTSDADEPNWIGWVDEAVAETTDDGAVKNCFIRRQN